MLSSDSKNHRVVETSIKDKGKLVDFQPQFTFVDWVDGGLKEIEKRMNDLTPTMKYKSETTLPNDYFVEAKYEQISIYVFVNDSHAERNIIVRQGQDYYTFEGNKEKAESVVTWADQQRILKR